MKGKRFLDSKIYKNTDLDFSPSIYVAEQPSVRSAPSSSFSASANFFSFGLLGTLNSSGSGECLEEEGVPSIQGRSAPVHSYYFGDNDGYDDKRIVPTRIDLNKSKSRTSSISSTGHDSILNYPPSPTPSSTTSSSSSSPFQSPLPKKGPGSPSPSPFSLRFNRRASEGGKRNPLFGGGSILGLSRPFGPQNQSNADKNNIGRHLTDSTSRKGMSPKSYGETLFVQDDTQLIITTHSVSSQCTYCTVLYNPAARTPAIASDTKSSHHIILIILLSLS